jgi:hypothetical protein
MPSPRPMYRCSVYLSAGRTSGTPRAALCKGAPDSGRALECAGSRSHPMEKLRHDFGLDPAPRFAGAYVLFTGPTMRSFRASLRGPIVDETEAFLADVE